MGFFDELKKGLACKVIDVGAMSTKVYGDDLVKCVQLATILEADPSFINKITGATDSVLAEVICKEGELLESKGVPADVYAYFCSEIAVADGKLCKKCLWIDPMSADTPLLKGYEATFGAGTLTDKSKDYRVSGGVLTAFTAPRAYVRIPYGVTAVGSRAFSGNDRINTVFVPPTVKKICSGAFSGCKNLRRVYMAPSVTVIEDGAFEDAVSLSWVFAPGVTELGSRAMRNTAIPGTACFPSLVKAGDRAFANCRMLKDIDVTTVEKLGAGMFEGCVNAATLKLSSAGPAPVDMLGCGGRKTSSVFPSLRTVYADCRDGVIRDKFFAGCDGVEKIVVHGRVNTLGRDAFRDCSGLKEAEFPFAGAQIPAGCFKDCTSLEKAPLFRFVKQIGDEAFENCIALDTVNLGKEVDEIGARAFANCRKLRALNFGSTPVFLNGKCGDEAFSQCGSLIYPPVLTETSSTGNRCFEGARKIDTVVCFKAEVPLFVTFPDAKGSIRQVQYFGDTVPDAAFSELPALTTVRFDSRSGRVAIKKDAFNGDKSLSSILRSEMITEIGEGAFSGTSLTKLTLSSIEKIEARAFSGIKKDLTVEIPSEKKSIADGWDPEWQNAGKKFIMGAKLNVVWL